MRFTLPRGQSLWILTKMAMVFFIVSLAALLLIFGGFTRSTLCASSASETSGNVASAITQVLNSPLEDERRVVSLDPALPAGGGQATSYNVTIGRRVISGSPFNALIVTAQSYTDRNCRGSIQVAYPAAMESNLFLISDRTDNSPAPPFSQTITLQPSLTSVDESNGLGKRTRYLVAMKCTSKTVAQQKYLFINDCVKDNADNCINFASAVANGVAVCQFGS